MTKTREELVTRALRKLGAIGAGQAPAPEDSSAVDDTVDTVMADLAQRNIYVWGDPDQLDDQAFEHLAEILAHANARDFGQQPDEARRLLAESRLRELQPVILSGQPQRVEYY